MTVSFLQSHDACFACGRSNEHGLGLTFEPVDGGILCRTTLGPQFQSYAGVTHGGILAAVADATMVHLVYQHHGGKPLTCRLEVRYRALVRVGDEIVVRATLVAVRHRIARATCRIFVGTKVCVEASAAFKL